MARIRFLPNSSAGAGKHGAEQPVEHGGLPLDEGFVLQHQRRAAEDDDDREAHPQHRSTLRSQQLSHADLHDRRADRDRRGDVDVGDLEGDEEQDDREEVEKEFHGAELLPKGAIMSIVRLVEYADAAPEVRAVYDEIMQARGTDWINNFWKAAPIPRCCAGPGRTCGR